MNNKREIALSNHIKRLEEDVAERDPKNPWHKKLNETDLKNIASLREARIPLYNDHMECLVGDEDYPMMEFSNLKE